MFSKCIVVVIVVVHRERSFITREEIFPREAELKARRVANLLHAAVFFTNGAERRIYPCRIDNDIDLDEDRRAERSQSLRRTAYYNEEKEEEVMVEVAVIQVYRVYARYR